MAEPLPAFVTRRKPDWTKLEETLARLHTGKVSLDEVSQLDRLYRRVAADLAVAQARYANTDVARFLNQLNATAYALEVRFPEWDGEPAESFLLGDITSDGDGTQTEISDAFKSLIATAPYARLLELVSVSATGAATIVFTGRQLGRPFVVADAAEAGDWASITHTTTAAQYTKLVQGARWDEDTAAGAVGKIYVNL